MSSSVSSFFSALFPTTVYSDAPEEKEEKEQPQEEEAKDEGEDGGEEPAEEEEEEEPEDEHPKLREECENSSKCASLTKHFQHCQEKVSSGQGFKGEDCVEELCVYPFLLKGTRRADPLLSRHLSFHMMHCVDNCVAPKLFPKLK
ncbi:hypothetical protein OE88DRAFT_545606 [Heliocybe sulcata]|uniref:Ubiquinol-cytochrome C reductase hinge domain-containing protein n=1 Tax=Heliocybe sulcata TaxID=5364 RepID=A0A5C3MTP6_9AGAM|nr:hypothetical protein OE88DRAFT_545606 [Heliocybe sulcata]